MDSGIFKSDNEYVDKIEQQQALLNLVDPSFRSPKTSAILS
jgi:hypothetical protein